MQLSLECCDVPHSFVAEGFFLAHSYAHVLQEDDGCHSVQGYLLAGRYASAYSHNFGVGLRCADDVASTTFCNVVVAEA